MNTPDVKKRPGHGAEGAEMNRKDRCCVSSKRTFLASRQGYIAENFLFVGLLKAWIFWATDGIKKLA
jgi:hypothetical protein